MKKFKTKISILAITLFVSSILFISCSKNDDATPEPKVYPEENFLPSFLMKTGLDQVTNTTINSTVLFEIGIEFTPLVTGRLNSLKIKMPILNNSLRIQIWDKELATILRTEIVNVSVANFALDFDINDLNLVKNKSYIISINSDDFYFRSKLDNTDINYPITVGNIKVNDFVLGNGSNSNMPSSSNPDRYFGDFSFNFQQTE
jgi:hypothetical protein